MLKSSHYISLLILVSAGMIAGCTLETPAKGTTCHNMLYVQLNEQDKCYNETDCARFDIFTSEHLQAISYGLCPETFVCAPLPEENNLKGASYCYYKNTEGMVFCDGKYIDPLNDREHCGASGTCKSKDKDLNWEGAKCNADSYCNNGVCIKIAKCGEGTHADDKEGCVPDTNNDCGDEHFNCQDEDMLCYNGTCIALCPVDTIECGAKDSVRGICVNSATNNAYCGATEVSTGVCENYTLCTMHQTCTHAQCIQTSCPQDEALCGQGQNAVCMSIQTDSENCGKCGHVCKDHPVNGAHSERCESGSCVYTCDEPTINCGTETQPNCVNLKNNSQHCGECNVECNADKGETCSNGKCVVNTCDNQCLVDGSCTNSDFSCGISCTDCTTDVNAVGATCDNEKGKCIITKCKEGYHLAGNEGDYTCVQNSTEECGNTESTSVKNCNDIQHSDVVVCNPQKGCVVQSCESDYHLYEEDNSCEIDSVENCGYHGTQCKVSDADNACNHSSCVFECHSGYHRNKANSACIKDTEQKCGYEEINCTTRINGWKSGTCENSQCKVATCQSNYHKYDNTCESDTIDHCGDHTTTCAVPNAHNECVNGQCKFTCNEGFREVSGSCVSNTPTNCGPSNTNCAAIEGWADGMCSDNKCYATSCKTNYYVKNGQCIKNTNTDCNGINCTISNGTGVCKSGKCEYTCNTKYHLSSAGNSCEENTLTNCGSTGNNCNAIAHWAGGSCSDDGHCILSKCETGYHVYSASNICELNTTTNCLSHGAGCGTDANAIDIICNNTIGCQVTGCKTGYHKSEDGKKCEENKDTACGSHSNDCTDPSPYYATATCDKPKGYCKPSGCNAGYSLVGEFCIQNCFRANSYYCCASPTDAEECSRNYSYCDNAYSVGYEWTGCDNVGSFGSAPSSDGSYSNCLKDSGIDLSHFHNHYDDIYCDYSDCEEMRANHASLNNDPASLADILQLCYTTYFDG